MPNDTARKLLGTMKPLGGGDPIPLHKDQLLIGRRPTCDVQLDFERVSGKHAQLRFVKGEWYIRDLNSTNGTTVNGQIISTEHGILPDDEFGVAGHLFMLDYVPTAPTQVLEANQVLEEEMFEPRHRRSLLELAGLSSDAEHSSKRPRPERPAERLARPRRDEGEFDDPLAREAPDAPLPKVEASDDEFFQMIQADVVEPPKKRAR